MARTEHTLLPSAEVLELLSGEVEAYQTSEGILYRPSLGSGNERANGGCLLYVPDSKPGNLTEGFFGILNHSLLVRRVAIFLAEELNAHLGYEAADVKLICDASLFEDFAKRYEKQHPEWSYDHGIWAVAILKDSPQIDRRNEIIQLIEAHMYGCGDHLKYPPKSWNEIIVYLSDNHANQEIVTIKERVAEVVVRNKNNQQRLQSTHTGKHIALELEEHYFKALDFTRDDQRNEFIKRLLSLPEREDEKLLRQIFMKKPEEKSEVLKNYRELLSSSLSV
jgi:hypothetical protein